MFNEKKPIVPCEVIMHNCMSGDTKGQRCFTQMCWGYETHYATELDAVNQEITFFKDGALRSQYCFESMKEQSYTETGYLAVCFL